VAAGTIGNAPRTICCGPGNKILESAFQEFTHADNELFNWSLSLSCLTLSTTLIFFQPDGAFTDGMISGAVEACAGIPRLVHFALKLSFLAEAKVRHNSLERDPPSPRPVLRTEVSI